MLDTVRDGFLLSHKTFSDSPFSVNQGNCQPLSLLPEMLHYLSSHSANQPATQRIPVFSCYVLDCYVIQSHSACFWKLVFLGDACEVGCLGNCQLLHSSGRIRMQPWETYISFLASPLKCDAVTGSGLTRCRDAEKGRRGLQIHWFPLFLAVTLNEILHFPSFQEEGHAPLFLGNPGDFVTICM